MRNLCFLLALLFCSIITAQQKNRVALIIGNNAYTGHFQSLHGAPLRDASAMNNVLRKLGFETIVCTDLRNDNDSMSYYIEKFAKLANNAEMALFYYSGHAGIGEKDRFYLAPSGSYENASALVKRCYLFDDIDNRISKTSAPVKLYIIDACRSSISDTKQYVPYTPQQISNNLQNVYGSVYIYSTDIYRESRTGQGNYSIFTESLLSHLGDKEDLRTVWNRVSEEVIRVNHEQRPQINEDKSKPSKKIYLNPQGIYIYEKVKEGVDLFSIKTNPSNATITIDNKKYTSNDQIPLEYGKKYTLTVSAVGYDKYEGKVTATPYKTIYDIALVKLEKSKLTIRTNKPGAKVIFDGEEKGVAPVTIDTYSGSHEISIERKKYYDYSSNILLKGGKETHYAELKRKYPWTWSSNYIDQLNIISYHYSPKNQIGFSYMYRIEDSFLSLGGIIGVSPGLFKRATRSNVINQSIDINIVDGNVSVEKPTTIKGAAETEYSNFIDPYNEAKHYDASFLALANVGFSPINGIMLETGLGTGYHQDKYHMNDTYDITPNTTTDPNTGKISESYTYSKTGISQWYKQNEKWSLAARLGARFIFPLVPSNDVYFSLGGGYTFLFSNNKYSSWDANIGVCWCL